ncbi:hypothetical protein [Humibacter antri]
MMLEPVEGGWIIRFGSLLEVRIGHRQWWESSPYGRPICANGAWQSALFVADICVIKSPHQVRVTIDSDGSATAVWVTIPLTSPNLLLHLRSPLMTRPDVA